MMRSLLSLFVVSCVALSDRPVLATTFDLKADFSAANNPHGAWAYFVDGTLIPSLGSLVSSLEGWSKSGATLDASVLRTLGTAYGAHDWESGDIVVHVPSAWYGNILTIRWTAPQAGTISISGRVWDAEFFPDRNAQWWLAVAGTAIASRGDVRGLYRGDTAASFAANLLPGASLTGISVQAGDQVDLMFERTTDFSHFAGVDETIEFVPTVALADYGATRWVVLLGLIGVVVMRRAGSMN